MRSWQLRSFVLSVRRHKIKMQTIVIKKVLSNSGQRWKWRFGIKKLISINTHDESSNRWIPNRFYVLRSLCHEIILMTNPKAEQIRCFDESSFLVQAVKAPGRSFVGFINFIFRKSFKKRFFGNFSKQNKILKMFEARMHNCWKIKKQHFSIISDTRKHSHWSQSTHLFII